MIQKVFGIRDSKSQAFLQPFFSVAVGSAIRAFTDAVNDTRDPNNQIARHPEDYVLYEIADYNDSTGEFVSCNPIKMLGVGKDFVVVTKPVRDVNNEMIKEVLSHGQEKK